MESVVYNYRMATPASIASIQEWQWNIAGPFPTEVSLEGFEQLDSLPKSPWPESWMANGQTIEVVNQRTHKGWLDLQHLFFEKHHGATPLTLLGHHAYAQHEMKSKRQGEAILRLGLDDWAVVWWNGERVATFQHEDGFEVAEVPVKVRQGSNTCLIKTNNTDQPLNKRLWALHAALVWENSGQGVQP